MLVLKGQAVLAFGIILHTLAVAISFDAIQFANRHGVGALIKQPTASTSGPLETASLRPHLRNGFQPPLVQQAKPTSKVKSVVLPEGSKPRGHAWIELEEAPLPTEDAPPATRVHPRQLGGLGLPAIPAIVSALMPGMATAIAPIAAAAASAAPAGSAIQAASPSANLVADLLDPAVSAAGPVISNLAANLISAAAAPLGSALTAMAAGAVDPIASLALPVQTAVAAALAPAIGPLASALAPVAGITILPQVAGALGTLAGPLETGLIAPLESLIAPLASNLVAAALPAVTGLEGQAAQAIAPLLSIVDANVLPLVTSLVAGVVPAIAPLITPLNPVFCALQPAEVPLGGSVTALVPAQCVSLSSGALVPVPTSVASGLVQAAGSAANAVITTGNNLFPFPSTAVAAPTAVPAAASTAAAALLTPLAGASPTLQALSLAPSSVGSLPLGEISIPAIVPSANPLASIGAASSIAAGIFPLGGLPFPVVASSTNTSASGSAASGVATGFPLPGVVSSHIFSSTAISSQIVASSNLFAPSSVLGSSFPTTLLTSTTSIPCPCAAGAPPAAASSAANPAVTPMAALAPVVPPTAASSAPIAAGALMITAYGPNTVILAGQTLLPGGPPATINGYVYSMPTSGMPIMFYPASTGTPVLPLTGAAAGGAPGTVTVTEPCPLAAASSAAGALAGSSSALTLSTSLGNIIAGKALKVFPDATSSGSELAALKATSVSASSSKSPFEPGCSFVNGSNYVSSNGNSYTVVCNINYPSRDITPYLVTADFDTCVLHCDGLNKAARDRPCAAALFVKDAPSGAANCYLKYLADNPTAATIPMQAAVLVSAGSVVDNGVGIPVIVADRSHRKAVVKPQLADANITILALSAPSTGSMNPGTSLSPMFSALSNGPQAVPISTSALQTSSSSRSLATNTRGLSGFATSSVNIMSVVPIAASAVAASVPLLSVTPSISLTSTFPSASILAPQSPNAIRVVYAAGGQVLQPVVSATIKLGASSNQPSTEYINIPFVPSLQLPADLRAPVVDLSLATAYEISQNTGILEVNSTMLNLLASLTNMPSISRDGGKGGYLSGQNIFLFADTGLYTTPSNNVNGEFVGYAGSSVATDLGNHAAYGNPIVLQDNIGEWANSSGAMRGFAPLTTGEYSYNLANQGSGQRYAIWPESSLIPLNSTASILTPAIVFDDVNPSSGAATFTYAGNTLLTVTADTQGGPVAERTVGRLFNGSEVEWGCVGGIRSWGPSGIGGNDGYVYLMGNVQGGLLLARTNATSVAETSTYQFHTGSGWSVGAPASDSTAYFIQGSFMDVDLFYSPRHLTFIITYMNNHGDSTIYWRYLQAPMALLPPYAGGDPTFDLVESITRYGWSDEQVLITTGTGLNGAYTYAAGAHLGYFGSNDLANGGKMLLMSWTAPTGQDPASQNGAYQIITGVVAFN